MEKKKFTIYKKEHPIIRCRICCRFLPIKNFSYNSIKENHTGICRSCEWIKKHKDRLQYKNYEPETLKMIVKYIFETEDCLLNNIQEKLKISIDDLIDIIQFLKIGNKHYYIRVGCERCGKTFNVTPSKYKGSKFLYCCQECYWADKSDKMPKGAESQFYNRIQTKCDNCGKDIAVTPSDYEKKNKYGVSHNFCCPECYWEYRSKYYVGDKSNGKHILWTDEMRNKMKITIAHRLLGQNRLDTKPQKIVDSILRELNIEYVREFPCEYYSIDNYLVNFDLMIEVMGDYWHANPLRFNKDKYLLTNKQLEDIHRDKLKYSYIKNHYGIEILYLWENDIIFNPELCKYLILEYVKTNGHLSNYHSFNYRYNGEKLFLKNDLIIPYQNKPLNEYKTLLKKLHR